MERKPRLTTSTWAGQRQQPRRLKALNCTRELTLSSNERRRLRGKVVWGRIKAPQRGEAVGQPADDELIDALRPHEVFESVLTELAQRDLGGERVTNERLGRVGDKN